MIYLKSVFILISFNLLISAGAENNDKNAIEKVRYTGFLSDLLRVNYDDLNITTGCKDDLDTISIALRNKDIWAMKMVDSSGRFDSGFVWGNVYWLGSRRNCESVNEPIRVILDPMVVHRHFENLTSTPSPISVQYRIIWAEHHSPWQVDSGLFNKNIIHLGLCVPNSCNDDDSITLAKDMFDRNEFSGNEFMESSIIVRDTTTLRLKDDFYQNINVNLFWWIVVIMISLVIFGSAVSSYKKTQVRNQQNLLQNNNNGTSKDNEKFYPAKETFFEKLCLCFCIFRSAGIITSDNLGKDTIECIHGIRAIGMTWIIVGHLFYYAPVPINNLQITFTYAEYWYLQPFIITPMLVDTYFVVSGLVLSYIFFQTEKRGNKENAIIKFSKTVISRYLRLTPPYLTALVITSVLTLYLRQTSFYWIVENNDTNCSKYWWRNLLYINNLFPIKDMCLSFSWFLAVDFQCFVITSFLLIVLLKSRKLGLFLFGFISLASMAYCGYLGYTLGFILSLDAQFNTADYLYSPTYTRITAYFIGVLAGWYLSAHNRQLNLNKFYIRLYWVLSPSIIMFIIYGTVYKDISPIFAMFYTALVKPAWAVGTAWIIVACATGYGGIANNILTAKKLLPFSRMSYTAYLVNPICIMIIMMMAENAMHLDYLTLTIYSSGVVFIVFLIAFVYMMFFENPFIRLTNLLQGK